MAAFAQALGPYRIIRQLGAGGMGQVFLAEDPRLQRYVALKRLVTRTPSGAPLEPELLRAEARATARLNHPHIASVYDVIETDAGPCLVMEYVEGATLAERLLRGRLPLAEAGRYALQLAEALSAAHAHGVIHRDIKPANLQITPAGSVKLLDLGIASVAAAGAETSVTTAVQQTGEVLGTPAYMAPEQRDLSRIGPFTDVYAAGLVMLEMFTGRAVTTDVDALLEYAPAHLRPVLTKATARNPAHRYRDGGELHAALAAVLQSTRQSRELRVVARAKAAALVLALVLLTASAVWTVARINRGGSPPERLAIAVLPVLDLSADETTGQMASVLTSLLVHNLTAIPNTVIVGGASSERVRTSTDREAVAARLGITHLLEASLQRAIDGRYRADVGLRVVDGGEVWRARYEGDVLAVQRAFLSAFAGVLVDRGLIARPLDRESEARLQRLPTNNVEAFELYATARAILDSATAARRLDEAMAALTKAITREPTFALAHAALSDAYRVAYNRGRSKDLLARARAAAETALAHDPELAAAHFSLASTRNIAGEPEGAIRSLRTAIAVQPSYDEAHRLLGRILVDRGHIDEGIERLQHAIALRPDSFTNHYSLALVYYNLGRHDAAIPLLKRATELQPDSAIAYNLLGATHQRLGQTDAAIGYFAHATKIGPSANAWTNLGKLLYDSGRIRESLEPFLKAVELDARSAVLRRNAGDAYARLGDKANARAMYERAIALLLDEISTNPRDAEAIALIAVCEAKLDRFESALRHAAEAVVLAPENRDVLYKQAVVHALARQPDAALRALERAIRRGFEASVARNDDDLAILRSLPAFEQVVTGS